MKTMARNATSGIRVPGNVNKTKQHRAGYKQVNPFLFTKRMCAACDAFFESRGLPKTEGVFKS